MASLREAVSQMLTALDRLGIRYAVGGSFASSKFNLFIAGRHPLGGEPLAHRKLVKTAILGGDPLEVQRDRADYAYLETQASWLGVSDLLGRLW